MNTFVIDTTPFTPSHCHHIKTESETIDDLQHKIADLMTAIYLKNALIESYRDEVEQVKRQYTTCKAAYDMACRLNEQAHEQNGRLLTELDRAQVIIERLREMNHDVCDLVDVLARELGK